MKALVKAEAAPGLWLRDVPEPDVKAGEVLIRVLRTGICGTDLHVRSWDAWAQGAIRPPVILGHEIAGRVTALGSGVDTVDVGDLVSVEGHIVCGRCRSCLAGRLVGRHHWPPLVRGRADQWVADRFIRRWELRNPVRPLLIVEKEDVLRPEEHRRWG